MSDRVPFLRAICESPLDDAPRLVFADWLDERGDAADAARAEFIRVQCELAREPPAPGRWSPLHLRQLDLLRDHERRWRAELPNLSGVIWQSFERGFVAAAVFEDSFVRQAGAAFAATPLEQVILRSARGRFDDGSATRGAHEREVLALAESRYLGRLRTLKVEGSGLGPGVTRVFAASPYPTRIEVLITCDWGMDDLGLMSFAAGAGWASLREWYASGNDVTDLGAEALAASGMQLKVVDLSANAITDRGLDALLRMRDRGLRQLVLRANPLTPHGEERLRTAFML
jgi:uncharacterized protein (TIGR02996 family)